MKKIAFTLVFLGLISIVAKAQVSTFSGDAVQAGWSGSGFSKPVTDKFMDENWGKVPLLRLQDLAYGQKLPIEFLWKVTDVAEAVKSSSSFIKAGCRVDLLHVQLQADGSGTIYMYQKESLVARVKCHSSEKRGTEEFSQIPAGDYHITSAKERDRSKEFKAPMPNCIRLDGIAGKTGKTIHSGEMASSHGCIRVSFPVGEQLMKIVSQNTIVRMEWK